MTIKETVAELWPGDCAGEEYPGQRKLMCLACHPDQPKWTDTENGVVRICESLLREFYGAKLDERTETFEDCGGWKEPDPVLTPLDPADPTAGYEVAADDPYLVFPKQAFANAEEFYSDFD